MLRGELGCDRVDRTELLTLRGRVWDPDSVRDDVKGPKVSKEVWVRKLLRREDTNLREGFLYEGQITCIR